ncbi:TonB-dependent receptor [Pseudoalteromonas sp. OOF1S-7]|uniref:TonB-dependent receptor plug domain-containing protein n=1 Tax=Pseudoalteromonas sp. OOF1S-7 TaxID=2917757 RepID=UPI001EF52285|nr:TonB-dependent receptor [Pseudoalteromonas sp. OOF1S-7]MCG7536643.1 TonB-dependent receptor [Pseudoalteromonas sp. OOF1S-7]
MLNFRKSAVALCVSMSCAVPVYAEQQVSEKQDMDVVEVTGSRIKRADLEGASPLVTITAEDIQMQGHANVFDALSAISSNSGIFIGEANSNNFNANAQALNLRGFGSSYSLVLINGRRIPVLPKPSGTVSGNVTNLATIPSDAVKRIEILSGGASAIYGSDAVTGVVNVILKDDVDESTLTYRRGDTKDGGGASDKLSFTTGGSFGDTNFTLGVELDQRKPIHGDDRDWFDEPTDGPDETRHGLTQVMSYWARYQPDPYMLIDIEDKCAAVGYEAVYNPNRTPFKQNDSDTDTPHYCGDNTYDTYTVRNDRDRSSLFLHLDHDLDADTSLYADIIGMKSEGEAGIYRYSFKADYDVRGELADGDSWLGSRHFYRTFRSHEVPTSNQAFDETSLTFITGIRGVIAGEYDYSVSFSGGQYDYEDRVVRFDDQKMLAKIFGEKGKDWDQPWDGSRWVTVNASQLNSDYTPKNFDILGELTPQMFNDVTHTSVGKGDSAMYNLAFELSGTLMELDSGPLQFATVAEVIQESYEFITDQPTVDGDIYGWSGIRGKGDRDHYAIGFELAIPLMDESSGAGKLDATLAARYDHYDDKSDVNGAATYQLGLTWRPMEELMLRTNYATSFRAPDMHVMNAERSSSFASGTDFYECATKEGLTAGQGWKFCSEDYNSGSVRRYTEGDLSLKEETGYSASIGMVADITDNWSMTLDFYKLHLENQIGVMTMDGLFRYEAECLLGFGQFDSNIDKNSPKCQDALSRVQRGGPKGGVTSVSTIPYNIGFRQQTGVDFSTSYKIDTHEFGTFKAKLDYSHIFESPFRFLPEDEVEDIRDLPWNNTFRTKTNLTLGWNKEAVSASLFINRLGTSPVEDAEQPERYPAWTTVNLKAGYDVTEDISLSLSVVNLLDKKPHQHESEKWWPFADINKYNPVGMEYFLQAKVRF